MSSFEFTFRPPKSLISNETEKSTFKLLTPMSVKSNSNQTFGSKPNSELKTSELFLTPKSFNENKAENSCVNQFGDGLSDEMTSDSSLLKRRVAQEIEKIETWKAITELEIQKKNDQIKDLKDMVEVMRNKIIGIQSENNSLKMNINAESAEREEVVTKMNNTREMFLRVKNYVEHIENRVNSFQEIKHLMERVCDQRRQQFDELTDKFCHLDLNHKTIVSNFEDKVTQKDFENLELRRELAKVVDQLNEFKIESENSFNALDMTLKSVNDEKESLQLAINELRDQLMTKNAETDEFSEKVKQLSEQLEALNALHESTIISAQQKGEEFAELRVKLEIELNELQNKCEFLFEQKNTFEKQINDLEVIIENMKEDNCKLVSEKAESNETINDLNSKLESVENEKEMIRTNAEIEKQTLINDYEKSIEEFRTNVSLLEEKSLELTKLKEQNQSLIESLESKANESLIEKENIETKLQTEMNALKTEFESKSIDFESKTNGLEIKIGELEGKVSESEQKKEELEKLRSEYETKINQMLSEIQVLKSEKESLENSLEREKCSLEKQISNMNNILESVKSDYNKRIEDKEDNIKAYKRESERMQYNVDILSKKCEKIESEKANISLKLQELTLSTLRSHSSPNRVSTPQFLSPIETNRLSSGKSSNKSNPKAFRDKLGIISPVKVNMSSIADQSDKYHFQLDDDKDEPFPKKLKPNKFGQKNYSKKNVRVENIMKGRPTPTKSNDLSWLNF